MEVQKERLFRESLTRRLQSMASIRVVGTTDVPPGKMKKVTVGGKDILIANVNGVYWALNNKCPHMGGSLAEGVLDGDIVTCPRHGSQYDVKTGQAVGKAKVAFFRILPGNAEHYQTRVEGNDVIVELP
jgi:3-phenylpropionate/trans-cinnamate dioxygenase ferredoxin component